MVVFRGKGAFASTDASAGWRILIRVPDDWQPETRRWVSNRRKAMPAPVLSKTQAPMIYRYSIRKYVFIGLLVLRWSSDNP
jgi:hypothetical protein